MDNALKPAHIERFIEEMKVNNMYELPGNAAVKWAMIEHNEMGYCWTIGLKGSCTALYSTSTGGEIKFWPTEAEAKSDLTKRVREQQISNY